MVVMINIYTKIYTKLSQRDVIKDTHHVVVAKCEGGDRCDNLGLALEPLNLHLDHVALPLDGPNV